MSVQLGGGTDIGGALSYCETLVRIADPHDRGAGDRLSSKGPTRPGCSPPIRRLCESGVKVLGLAALDAVAQPAYDRQMAERCVAVGAEVAALTPQRLAEWLGRILS